MFNLIPKFPVVITETIYYGFIDIISILGGYQVWVQFILITIPTIFLASPKFVDHMTKVLLRKEKRKSKGKSKSFDEIKSLYLMRVSHEGIY